MLPEHVTKIHDVHRFVIFKLFCPKISNPKFTPTRSSSRLKNHLNHSHPRIELKIDDFFGKNFTADHKPKICNDILEHPSHTISWTWVHEQLFFRWKNGYIGKTPISVINFFSSSFKDLKNWESSPVLNFELGASFSHTGCYFDWFVRCNRSGNPHFKRKNSQFPAKIDVFFESLSILKR